MAAEDNNVQHYLNPLTVEAQIFLNAMKSLGKINQVDPTLCATLENVVCEIKRFLEQGPAPIVATEKTQLVDVKDIRHIHRVYHCVICKIDLGKSAEKAAAHLADGHLGKNRNEVRKLKRKAEQEKRLNAVLNLPKKTRSLISYDVAKFFNENMQIAEKLKQIPDYEQIEKALHALVTPLFPDQPVKLFKFGSRISGIGTRNSDLDIFIDIGNTFNSFENRASLQTLKSLYKVRDALKGNRTDWRHLTVIDNARVPILRVTNSHTGIDCDLGFSNSLGYCNTKLMEYLFELQPIARHMCLFLKKWLERSKLTEISTYSISLLVIYFLQVKELLPSISQLQLDLNNSVCVGPWIANFEEKSLIDLKLQSVEATPLQCKKFLKLFFEFYAVFDFSRYVVCPYLGRQQVEIKQFEAEMPTRYTDFVKSAESGKDCGLELNKLMVVQDPIQLNHNVTKATSVLLLKTITAYFRQSAETFAELKL